MKSLWFLVFKLIAAAAVCAVVGGLLLVGIMGISGKSDPLGAAIGLTCLSAVAWLIWSFKLIVGYRRRPD